MQYASEVSAVRVHLHTHKSHTFTGHIGARDWKDAVEKLASARTNARITGERVKTVEGGRHDDDE